MVVWQIACGKHAATRRAERTKPNHVGQVCNMTLGRSEYAVRHQRGRPGLAYQFGDLARIGQDNKPPRNKLMDELMSEVHAEADDIPEVCL